MKNIIYPSYVPTSFDYLGEVPKHWATMVLRRLTTNHKQGYYTSSGYVDSGVKLLRITDIGENGVISYADCPNVSSADPTLKNFLLKNGDFVFARTGGAGSFGLVQDLSEDVVFASYLIRFQFNAQRATSGFLKYYLLSYSFFRAIGQNVHGGVNQNIHAEDIKNAAIAIPPLEEQTQIAKFLDYETAKIDALIAKQQQLIALLQEKRQAVISHAVTKGLNPAAPLRDSGVAWLGQVPAHWEVAPLKRFIEFQRGHDLPTEDRREGNYPVVSSAGPIGTHNDYRCKGPGIVTGRYGTIGEFYYVPKDFWPLNTALYSINCHGNNERFLLYMLRNMKHLFVLNSLKAAVPGVDRNDVHREYVAAPQQPQEQQAIANYLDDRMSRFDELTRIAEAAVELLQERRTALISAAVTGKIDVRGWQQPLANAEGATP